MRKDMREYRADDRRRDKRENECVGDRVREGQC